MKEKITGTRETHSPEGRRGDVLHQAEHGQLVGVHHRPNGRVRHGCVRRELRRDVVAGDRDVGALVAHRVAVVRRGEHRDALACNIEKRVCGWTIARTGGVPL